MKRALEITAIFALFLPSLALAQLDLSALNPGNWTMPDWAHPDRVTIAPSYNYGVLDGYLQVPAGGQPGTSTLKRPTLDELNMDGESFFEMVVGGHWNKFGAYGRYRYFRPSGHAILGRPVVTHAISLPAGTNIGSEAKFDTYSVGAKYDFYWNSLIVAPKIEFSLLNFSYRFNTTTGITSRRSFTAGALRLGLDVVYPLTVKSNVVVTGMFTIPSLSNLDMYDIVAVYNYRLIQNDRMTIDLFAGGGASYLDFKDGQALPNHIHVSTPLLKAGISVTI